MTDPPNIGEQAPPLTLGQAVGRGARLGLKWATYIAGPFAAIFLAIGIVITAWELVFDEGLSFFLTKDAQRFLLAPFGFYLSSCLWGIIIGVVWAVLEYAIRRWKARAEKS